MKHLNVIGKTIYSCEEKICNIFYKMFREWALKSSLGACGENVYIAKKSDFRGIENVFIGNDVSIGPNSLVWTTRANFVIHDKVIIGPNLTVITGNHKINYVGKYIGDVNDDEKDLDDDQNVIIESDVWIGANVTILKGVTVAKGCVIGGGTVLTKNTEPYSVYVGVPGRKIKDRFSQDELSMHINTLNEK